MSERTREEAAMERLDGILALVRTEVLKAVRRWPSFNSPHEGWAVILEEVEELWDEVKGNNGREVAALDEALQVAAMGVRYILDCAPPGRLP